MFRGFVTSLQKQNASSIKKKQKIPPQKTNHPLQKNPPGVFFRNRLRRPLHPRASPTPRKPRLLPKTQKAVLKSDSLLKFILKMQEENSFFYRLEKTLSDIPFSRTISIIFNSQTFYRLKTLLSHYTIACKSIIKIT